MQSTYINGGTAKKVVNAVFVFVIFVFAFIGIIFLAVGSFVYFHIKGLEESCTESATATVVSLKESDGAYSPVLEFTDSDGETVRLQNGTYSSDYYYEVGDTVEIRYDPEYTSEYLIEGKTNETFRFVGRIFGGIGAVLVVITVILFIIYVIKRHKDKELELDEIESYTRYQ